jgi:diguanylate cyclase (GGDEF)-like protein/PAS domain S-box-containing protein
MDARPGAALDADAREPEGKRSGQAQWRGEVGLGMILDSLPLAIAYIDREQRYLMANVGFETLQERSREEIIGRTVREVMGEEAYRELQPRIARTLAGGETEFVRQHTSQTGSTRYLHVQHVPDRSAEGVRGYFVLISDITAQKRAEAAMRDSEERFRSLSKLGSDFYWETDESHRFRPFTQEGAAKPGTWDSALGKTAWEIPAVYPSEDGWRAHKARMDGHLPFRDFEFARRAADGDVRWYSVSGEPVFDASGDFTGYRGVGRDISDRKHAEQELERLAHYDKLTGLPNRAMLQDRLAQALLRAQRNETLVAVLFLDLDRFKEVNDSLGHAVGDALLHEVARRIASCLRSTDTVARLGGDEFTVLLEGVHRVEEIERVAGKILTAVARPLRVGAHELAVSTSIGATVYPLDDQDQDTLLKNADMAMYHAKQEGRNNIQFFSPEMGTHSERRMDLTTGLRHAVERGELSAHYQPLVEVKSGRLVGLEALLRWENPDFGKVSPAQFIPIAEDTGLIVPIGEWMLRAVCRQMRAWRRAGRAPGYVAVNLSPRQFRQQDVVELVYRVLREYSMPPDSLELEITESTVMQRTEEAIMKMRRLRKLGVRIAIDDFGTGYSSLAYLQRFPVHTLKVDQSFVRDIRSDKNKAAIVSTVIGLARSLKLTALAEGVETREQLEFLRGEGCELYQGYLYSRPLPAAEIEPLLEKQAAQRRPAARPRRLRSGPSRRSSPAARTGRGRRRAT